MTFIRLNTYNVLLTITVHVTILGWICTIQLILQPEYTAILLSNNAAIMFELALAILSAKQCKVILLLVSCWI